MVWSTGLVAEGAVFWRSRRGRWCGLKVWQRNMVSWSGLLEEHGLKGCLLEINGVVLRSAGQENDLICSAGTGSQFALSERCKWQTYCYCGNVASKVINLLRAFQTDILCLNVYYLVNINSIFISIFYLLYISLYIFPLPIFQRAVSVQRLLLLSL